MAIKPLSDTVLLLRRVNAPPTTAMSGEECIVVCVVIFLFHMSIYRNDYTNHWHFPLQWRQRPALKKCCGGVNTIACALDSALFVFCFENVGWQLFSVWTVTSEYHTVLQMAVMILITS